MRSNANEARGRFEIENDNFFQRVRNIGRRSDLEDFDGQIRSSATSEYTNRFEISSDSDSDSDRGQDFTHKVFQRAPPSPPYPRHTFSDSGLGFDEYYNLRFRTASRSPPAFYAKPPESSKQPYDAPLPDFNQSFQSTGSSPSSPTGENNKDAGASSRPTPGNGNGDGNFKTVGHCSKPNLYTILGVESSSSKGDIKKAYYRLCRVHHPDKGGDTDKFKELVHAFNLLSDEKIRHMYDLHGHAGIDGEFPWKTQAGDGHDSSSASLNFKATASAFSQQSNCTSRTASQESSTSSPHETRDGAVKSGTGAGAGEIPKSRKCDSFVGSDEGDSDSSELNFNRQRGGTGTTSFCYRYSSEHCPPRCDDEDDDQLGQDDPTIMRLDCTLEEIYCGSTMQIAFSRKCVCDGCQGSGYSFKTLCSAPFCPRCNGTGREVHSDVSILSNSCVQVPCSLCDGKGMLLNLADVCSKCVGDGFSSSYVTDEVLIPRGTKHGTHVLVRRRGGDSSLSTSPGDVFAEVNEIGHAFFRRHGDDLLVRKKLTLKEAICGTYFEVVTLDERVLALCIAKGEVVTPGEMRRIRGEGMPINHNAPAAARVHVGETDTGFGDLILEFEVDFPRRIPPSLASALEKVWAEDDGMDDTNTSSGDQSEPSSSHAANCEGQKPKSHEGKLHHEGLTTESENISPNRWRASS